MKNGLDHVHVTKSEQVYMKELQQCKDGESILSNLFTASLAQFDTRLTKTEFTVVARQFLWLPPLKNPTCGELKCGCEVQLCFGTTTVEHKARTWM
jgi:hypothetical protein